MGASMSFNPTEFLEQLIIFGYPWTSGGGGGTVTNIGTGTGLTGGPITTTGTISFASVSASTLLANISGISAAPTPQTLTAVLDALIDNTQGDILYRNGTVWTYLSPGTAGTFLQTGGPAANPVWAADSGGTVTSITSGTGITLTPGTITTTGSVALSSIADSMLLANISGSAAAPIANDLSDILDYTFDNQQGDILYRNGTVWTYLAAGTAGYVLQTGGPGANPSWVASSGGGGLTWVGIAGTTEAAAVNMGYVVQNAGLTTITLPAVAPLGSIVQVQGLGAGGWTLQANTGQNVQIGNTSTSSGGSVSSSDPNDSISVVCIVADTTWGLSPPVTADFSII